MTDRSTLRPRKGLFRAIALARYQGPIEMDAPHILPSWRPGLVIAAAVIAIALTIAMLLI